MIDPIAVTLVKFEGFNSCYEKFLAIPAPTHLAAYEMVEAIYERAFGCRKYSDFYSFKVFRYRKLKQQAIKAKSALRK